MTEAMMVAGADEVSELAIEIAHCAPHEAVERLAPLDNALIAVALQRINPSVAQDILLEFDSERREAIMDAAPAETGRQWELNQEFEEGTVGRLMEPPVAVYAPSTTVGETIESLRKLVRTTLVTYAWVTEKGGFLVGVITMRDLLLAERSERVGDIMLRDPFSLRPDLPLGDAMRLVLDRHYPVYPVCDAAGMLVGLVRGRALFEEQAFEISAQPGSMVGVEKEERLATPWARSLRFRHPWLQLNLLTAFVAAAVVGAFQGTIDRLVILATFLPVLAGQSGNTGCQALAVTLRGITLGELESGREWALVVKEASLGFLNGMFVGVTAGLGMYAAASMQHNPHALVLALVVFVAMIASCVVSGVAGALIPLSLRRAGADPATASSIFLTTATDVVSMGVLLGLATWLVR